MVNVIIVVAVVAAIALVIVRYVRGLRAGGCGCGCAELPDSVSVLGKEPIDRAACVAAIEAVGYHVA